MMCTIASNAKINVFYDFFFRNRLALKAAAESRQSQNCIFSDFSIRCETAAAASAILIGPYS